MPRNPLSIVETSRYVETLLQLRLTDRQADELIRGALFIIARNPREGIRIAPNSHVWAIFFDAPTALTESYVLYYAFDNEKIYLLALRPCSED